MLNAAQSYETERTLPVWATMSVHLQQTEVHAKLYFFLAILADKFPHHHLARLVIPVVQEVSYVEIHG